MGIEFGGLLGLIILALDIWAILKISQSSRSNENKVIWIVVILILPIIGLVLWLAISEKRI